jgi:hypothetical protein
MIDGRRLSLAKSSSSLDNISNFVFTHGVWKDESLRLPVHKDRLPLGGQRLCACFFRKKGGAAMPMLLIFVLLLAAVLTNALGVGALIGGGRPESWVITLILFATMLAVAGYGVKSRWDGVFIDKDNRISLSRFQLVMWTILIVSALMTAGLSNAVSGAPAPLDITIPPQIWALLGLGAFTAVAAPAIKESKRQGAAGAPDGAESAALSAAQQATGATVKRDQGLVAPAVFDGRVLSKVNSVDARWIDMIMGDFEGGAYVDVSKLQKLAFTAMLVTAYGLDIGLHFKGTTAISAFPAISTGFVALLAISHAAYLADKQIAST